MLNEEAEKTLHSYLIMYFYVMFKILRTARGGGYRYCVTEPPHPKRNAKGYYPLHRVLMENKIGRLLSKDEDVHHVDGNKNNDSIENLEILPHNKHARVHAVKRSRPKAKCECGQCGSAFTLAASEYDLRMRRNKVPFVFCSISCAMKFTRREVKTKSGSYPSP